MSKKYIPILRAKASELDAVKNLTNEQRNQIIPYFQIKYEPSFRDISQDIKTIQGRINISDSKKRNKILNRVKQEALGCYLSGRLDSSSPNPFLKENSQILLNTLHEKEEEYIMDYADRIASLMESREFFLNLKYYNPNLKIESKSPLSFVTSFLNNKKCKFTLVHNIDSVDELEQDVFQSEKNCLQLDLKNHLNLEDPIIESEYLNSLCESFKINKEKHFFLINLGNLIGWVDDINETVNQIKEFLQNSGIIEFKNIIISGCNFPSDVGLMRLDKINHVERKEWEIFSQLKKEIKNWNNNFYYSDYGIVNPEKPFSLNILKVACKIRYCSDDSWLVVRGVSPSEQEGWSEMIDLGSKIVNSEFYKGKEFSYGDQYLHDLANKKLKGKGTGSPLTWIRADLNHHIAFVVDQLKKNV